mgnify:CR=1 FL=1
MQLSRTRVAYGNWPGGDDEEDDEGEGGGREGAVQSEETDVNMAEARGEAAQQATAAADGSERTDRQTAEGAGGQTTSRDDQRTTADAHMPDSGVGEAAGPATPVRARAEASRVNGATGSATPVLDAWTLEMTKQ